jgi:hypothetical protein
MVKPLLLLAFPLLLILNASADDTNAAPATPPATSDKSTPGGLFLAPSNDSGIGSDGSAKDENSYQVRIGELYAPNGEAYILPVRVPALPAGQHIATIHFKAQLFGINNESNGLGNADLYGLGVRDTNKILPADYYQGSRPDSKATLLQANFLTPTSPVRKDPNTGPFVETSSDGDAALAKFFNDICAKPENAGKYIILRISYDVDPIPTGNNAHSLLTTGATGDNEAPVFTYTLSAK